MQNYNNLDTHTHSHTHIHSYASLLTHIPFCIYKPTHLSAYIFAHTHTPIATHINTLFHLQRSLNCNTYTEDGTIYRSAIGESTVSLETPGRSAKSSYLAYTLR